MKYLHYAPEAPLYLSINEAEEISKAVDTLQAEGKKVAFIGPDESR